MVENNPQIALVRGAARCIMLNVIPVERHVDCIEEHRSELKRGDGTREKQTSTNVEYAFHRNRK